MGGGGKPTNNNKKSGHDLCLRISNRIITELIRPIVSASPIYITQAELFQNTNTKRVGINTRVMLKAIDIIRIQAQKMSWKVLKMLCGCDSPKKGAMLSLLGCGGAFFFLLFLCAPHPDISWKPSICKKECWEVRAETSRSSSDDGVVPRDEVLMNKQRGSYKETLS